MSPCIKIIVKGEVTEKIKWCYVDLLIWFSWLFKGFITYNLPLSLIA